MAQFNLLLMPKRAYPVKPTTKAEAGLPSTQDVMTSDLRPLISEYPYECSGYKRGVLTILTIRTSISDFTRKLAWLWRLLGESIRRGTSGITLNFFTPSTRVCV